MATDALPRILNEGPMFEHPVPDSGRSDDGANASTAVGAVKTAGLFMLYDVSDLKESGILVRGATFTMTFVVHKATGENLVLKKVRADLSPELKRPVERELAREAHLLLSMVRHPNIVKAVSFDDGKLLVSKFHSTLKDDLPGERDSTAVWNRRLALKRWPIARAVRLALELAKALDHCHRGAFRNMRLLHRSVKPSNIGLGGDGRLKLFDFSCARLWEIGPNDDDGRELRNLTMAGSLRYDVDGRVMIYPPRPAADTPILLRRPRCC